ncbi:MULTISPECIES: hypothetical protein [unclassified Candidatus Cardinium]|uniref:hypothetical protein n=1 Tax=unclassified Candidatus Cardinium TaxID=2641185 RepID=UPI001FB23925|nr:MULTISPECIES: hypothetical protein [unclassified Candidatus Cardinium]
MDTPKESQAHLTSPEGLRQVAAAYMQEHPEICRDLFKYQEQLRQVVPTQMASMGWVSERFDAEYRDTCKKISALEKNLTTNKDITPE